MLNTRFANHLFFATVLLLATGCAPPSSLEVVVFEGTTFVLIGVIAALLVAITLSGSASLGSRLGSGLIASRENDSADSNRKPSTFSKIKYLLLAVGVIIILLLLIMNATS